MLLRHDNVCMRRKVLMAYKHAAHVSVGQDSMSKDQMFSTVKVTGCCLSEGGASVQYSISFGEAQDFYTS